MKNYKLKIISEVNGVISDTKILIDKNVDGDVMTNVLSYISARLELIFKKMRDVDIIEKILEWLNIVS